MIVGKTFTFPPPRHFLRFLPFYASYRCYTHYRPLTSIIWDVCHATESLYNYKRQNSSKCEVKVTFSPSFPGSVNPYISNTFYLKKKYYMHKNLENTGTSWNNFEDFNDLLFPCSGLLTANFWSHYRLQKSVFFDKSKNFFI